MFKFAQCSHYIWIWKHLHLHFRNSSELDAWSQLKGIWRTFKSTKCKIQIECVSEAAAGISLATSQWAMNHDKHAQTRQTGLFDLIQTLILYSALKNVFMLSLHSNDSWMLKGVGFWLKDGVVSVGFCL